MILKVIDKSVLKSYPDYIHICIVCIIGRDSLFVRAARSTEARANGEKNTLWSKKHLIIDGIIIIFCSRAFIAYVW